MAHEIQLLCAMIGR